MKEAVEMIGRLSATSARRSLMTVAAFALISVLLSSCGEGATSPGGISTSGSSAVTPTSTSASPSVTPASWRRIAVPPFSGYATTSVWDGAEMLVVHEVYGRQGSCREVAAAYDPSTNSWRKLPPVPRITRSECDYGSSDNVIWTGSEMLLWGATNSAYDPTTNSWRRVTDPPRQSLSSQVVVWTGRQMIGWGSLDCCDIAGTDGVAVTPTTGVATRLPDSPLSGGGEPMAAWTGREMVVAGGGVPEAAPEVVYAEAAAYHPATRTWSMLPPMPISRMGGTAVWDGNELLIFGGHGGADTEGERHRALSHTLARGVAYDPSTNRWRWLAAPAFPRDGAVYAWDGHEVLMWGGAGLDGSVPPHGEAYDPATDTWSPLPKAPLRARVGADAVWTGTELIIWAGIDARTATADGSWTQLSDGAAFTPASN